MEDIDIPRIVPGEGNPWLKAPWQTICNQYTRLLASCVVFLALSDKRDQVSTGGQAGVRRSPGDTEILREENATVHLGFSVAEGRGWRTLAGKGWGLPAFCPPSDCPPLLSRALMIPSLPFSLSLLSLFCSFSFSLFKNID
jgi:hypothetical protein